MACSHMDKARFSGGTPLRNQPVFLPLLAPAGDQRHAERLLEPRRRPVRKGRCGERCRRTRRTRSRSRGCCSQDHGHPHRAGGRGHARIPPTQPSPAMTSPIRPIRPPPTTKPATAANRFLASRAGLAKAGWQAGTAREQARGCTRSSMSSTDPTSTCSAPANRKSTGPTRSTTSVPD